MKRLLFLLTLLLIASPVCAAPNAHVWIDGGTISSSGSTIAGHYSQTGVASSATSVTCKTATANSLGVAIYNSSTQNMYLSFTSPAAVSSGGFFVKIPSNTLYELPFLYSGAVYCIWDSANGYANVLEVTP